jgi:hypothetical protein
MEMLIVLAIVVAVLVALRGARSPTWQLALVGAVLVTILLYTRALRHRRFVR